jgi:hypothetical protein
VKNEERKSEEFETMKKTFLFSLLTVLLCACGGSDYPVAILSTEAVDIDKDDQQAYLNLKVTVKYAEAAAEQYCCLAYIENGEEIATGDFKVFVESVEDLCYGAVDLEPATEVVTKEYDITIPLGNADLDAVDINDLSIKVLVCDADNLLFASETAVANTDLEQLPINDLSTAGLKKKMVNGFIEGAIDALFGGGSGGSSSSGGLFSSGSDDEKECPLCHGDGQCPYHSLAREEIDECDHCYGTNKCPKCNGRGYLDD